MNVLMLLLVSFASIAGQGTGNGGDAITCNGNVEVLDYYEGRERLGYTSYTFGSGTTEIEIAEYLIAKLDRDLLRYTIYKNRLDSFMSETEFTENALVDIPDHGYIYTLPGCVISQAAVQVDPSLHPNGKRYIIHGPTWNAMDAQNKAGLILHELIYREALEVGHSHSKGVRQANAFLAKEHQHPFSLESVMTSIENNLALDVDYPFFYPHLAGVKNPSYDITASKRISYGFLTKLYAYEKPASLTQAEVDDAITSSTKLFKLLHILRLSNRKYYTEGIREWSSYWYDFLRGNQYAYSIDTELLKNRISLESDMLTKSILSTRLPDDEFDFRLNLINEFAASSASDFLKSLSAGQVLYSIFGKNIAYEHEISPSIISNVENHASAVKVKQLIKTLLKNFKVLMMNRSSYPFYSLERGFDNMLYSGVGSHPLLNGLNSLYSGIIAGSFTNNDDMKLMLKEALVETLNESSDKVVFTNVINLLKRFNSFTSDGKVNHLDISGTTYEGVLTRKDDYLLGNEIVIMSQFINPGSNKVDYLWDFLASGFGLFTTDLKTIVSSCFTHRAASAQTSMSYLSSVMNKGTTACESLLGQDTVGNAHETLFDDITQENLLSSWTLASWKYTDAHLGEIAKLIAYNASQDNTFRLNVNDRITVYLVRQSIKEWKNYHIDVVKNSADLSENNINAIKFAFNNQKASIQKRVVLEIIGTQTSVSTETVTWLQSISTGQYDEDVKLAAVFVLTNLP